MGIAYTSKCRGGQALVFGLFLASCFWAGAQEPIRPQSTPRIVTATRLVTIFSGLETELLTNIQKKNEAGFKPLLSDDFQIWMAHGDPIPVEDWIEAVSANYALKKFKISQMSVRDFGNMAVVKFVRSQQAEFQGHDDSGEFLVVDVWIKDGDSWKLSDRYVSKLSSVPSAAKPTGKN